MCLLDISLLRNLTQPSNPGPIALHTKHVEDKTLHEINKMRCKMRKLSNSEVEGVEKFVLFIGHGRSGHSIIGSLMDAHPNIIISHQFMILSKWMEGTHMNKVELFNDLYHSSQESVMNGWRSTSTKFHKKGYTLDLPSQWQGCFTKLKVIGDKSGSGSAKSFSGDMASGIKALWQFQSMVNVPIMFIQVIRNPFDAIATMTLSENYNYIKKHRWDHLNKFAAVNQERLRDKLEAFLVLWTQSGECGRKGT